MPYGDEFELFKPRKTQEPSTLTRIHQTLEPYSIPGLYRRVKKFAGQAMDRLFETPPPKEGLRTLPELRDAEAQRKFPLEPSHIPRQEFPLVPSHEMNRPIPPLASIPTSKPILPGARKGAIPEGRVPIAGQERGLLTDRREGEYPSIVTPAVPTAGRESDLMSLEAGGVGMPGEAQGVAGPTSPLPSLTEPTKKGFLENIDRATLMGLATTGLSMMAKGGQYTEKPQTLGGIAGEAGLAGLGTYLHVKEREDALKAKADALAATQAYQAARLGQGEKGLELQERSRLLAERTQEWREKEAKFETREIPVGPGKTVKMQVLKSDVTPTPQTMDRFKMELLHKNPDLQADFLYNLTGHKGLTVKNLKTTGEGRMDVYSPSGKLIGQYNFLDEKVQTALGRAGEKRALDARKEIESGHRTEEGAIWKDLAAKAKVQTKDIVGKPADEVLRILMSGGVDKKEVDAALKKAETVRTKWNKFRSDWSRTYGPMMGAIVPPSAYEQPASPLETTSIFDQK